MKEYIQKPKALGLFCLSLTIIITLILFSHYKFASAQNKSTVQVTEITNNVPTNIPNIILVHGAWVDRIFMEQGNSDSRESRT